jgi:hypothetical protein
MDDAYSRISSNAPKKVARFFGEEFKEFEEFEEFEEFKEFKEVRSQETVRRQDLGTGNPVLGGVMMKSGASDYSLRG